MHAKAVAAEGEGVTLVKTALTGLTIPAGDKGLILAEDTKGKVVDPFIKAFAQHRYWVREKPVKKL